MYCTESKKCAVMKWTFTHYIQYCGLNVAPTLGLLPPWPDVPHHRLPPPWKTYCLVDPIPLISPSPTKGLLPLTPPPSFFPWTYCLIDLMSLTPLPPVDLLPP